MIPKPLELCKTEVEVESYDQVKKLECETHLPESRVELQPNWRWEMVKVLTASVGQPMFDHGVCIEKGRDDQNKADVDVLLKRLHKVKRCYT